MSGVTGASGAQFVVAKTACRRCGRTCGGANIVWIGAVVTMVAAVVVDAKAVA